VKKIIFLILTVSLFLILLQKVSEPDVFWHIKNGEIILKTGTIPEKDVFSFITEGKEWVSPEWLSDIVFYLVYRAGDFVLLNLFTILLFTSAFLLLYIILILRNVNPVLSGFLVITGALGSWMRSQPRPHIFTYLMFGIMILLIDEYRLRGKKYIWLLPLVSLLWVNLHPESAMAVLLFLSIIIMELLKKYINKSISGKYEFLKLDDELTDANLIEMGIVFLLTLGVNFIHPQGYKVFDFLFRHPDVVTNIEINEFLPLDYEGFPKTFISIVLLMVIGLAGIKRNFHVIHLVIGFGFLTMKFRRFVPEFYIFAIPSAGVALQYLIDSLKEFLKTRVPAKSFNIFSAVFLIIFIAFITYAIHTLFYYDVYKFKGLGVHKKYFPVRAFEFIRQNKIKPRVYNTANLGGAFIFNFFPEQKAFEDTRLISYEAMLAFKQSSNRPDFLKLTEYYDVNYALLDTDLRIITQYPNILEKWALVYFDDFCEILVKKSPENEYIYKGKEFLVINPETLEEFVESSIENSTLYLNAVYELRRAIDMVPDSFRLHYALGALLSVNPKNAVEAEAELRKSLEILPLYPYSNRRLAFLLEQQGKYREAIQYYRKFIRTAEANKWDTLSDIFSELGLLYIKAEDKKNAIRAFKKALKLDPANTGAKENLESLKRNRAF